MGTNLSHIAAEVGLLLLQFMIHHSRSDIDPAPQMISRQQGGAEMLFHINLPSQTVKMV
jgi:hypothetical protein